MGGKYKVIIKDFICDAPTRAFVKRIKGHASYTSCENCTVEGDYFYSSKHVCLNKENAPFRTDGSFRTREDEDHHVADSRIEELPIDMVKSCPLDYLHLIWLGVVK